MATQHSQQDSAVMFFFEAERTLRDFGDDLGPADFRDLDDEKNDNTTLLLSALLVTVTLFVLVGAGLMWFIHDNIAERDRMETRQNLAYWDQSTALAVDER